MKIRFKNVSALALAWAMMFSTWSPSIVHAANFELGSHVIKDEQSPTGYTAQFAIDSKEIDKIEEEANRGEVTKVELTGGFTYVDPEANQSDKNNRYSPDAYKNGMYASNAAAYTEEMIYNEDSGYYESDIPITSGSFNYSYQVTFSEPVIDSKGNESYTQKYDDPANPSNGSNYVSPLGTKSSTGDVNTSTVYGYWDEQKQSKSPNLDFVLPANGQRGTYSYVEIPADNNDTQRIGVYLPANYDKNKTGGYKTIYAVHGSGGNETDWFNVGKVNNIMDNMINAKLTESAIVVTLNRTYSNVTSLTDYIIPYMENNYNVSKKNTDRAICGLSAGGASVGRILFESPETFGYYGCFSGCITDNTVDKSKFDHVYVAASAGLSDIATETISTGMHDQKYERMLEWAKNNQISTFKDIGFVDGAHDWFTWTQSFRAFVSYVCWQDETVDMQEGVTVSKNTMFPQSDAKYQATFVVDSNQLNGPVVNVQLQGGFQFLKAEDDHYYIDNNGDASQITFYSAYEYKDGMYPIGGVSHTLRKDFKYDSGCILYNMERKGHFYTVTMPLPATEYYYGYYVTYANGTTKNHVQDPQNHSLVNDASGHDAQWSYVYVGDSSDALKGQEYIYERNDSKKGTIKFDQYETKAPTKDESGINHFGVYLPNGYEQGKDYKTLYLIHGGGGNETEWYQLGSAKNIFDNLITDGEVEDTVVIFVDESNMRGGFNTEAVSQKVDNLVNYLVPYVESHYKVSKNKDDRALSGLSQGSIESSAVLQLYTNEFKYYGLYSGTVTVEDKYFTDDVIEAMKTRNIFLAGGTLDLGTINSPSKGSFLDYYCPHLDKIGVNYDFELENGGHDWNVWRAALTTFVKDYLWNIDTKDDTNDKTDDKKDNTPDQDINNKVNTSTSDKTNNKENKNDKVKTGDMTVIAPFVLMAICAAIFIVLLGKKAYK